MHWLINKYAPARSFMALAFWGLMIAAITAGTIYGASWMSSFGFVSMVVAQSLEMSAWRSTAIELEFERSALSAIVTVGRANRAAEEQLR